VPGRSELRQPASTFPAEGRGKKFISYNIRVTLTPVPAKGCPQIGDFYYSRVLCACLGTPILFTLVENKLKESYIRIR